jgi:hypothetical protein
LNIKDVVLCGNQRILIQISGPELTQGPEDGI